MGNVLIGIYYTPYLVHSLGLAAYGILPLALIVNQYVSIVTGVMTSAYSRFYSVSLRERDYTNATKYLSSSFIVVVGLILLLIPFLLILIWKVDYFFSIPFEYVKSARLLFAYTFMSFFISLFCSMLNVTLYANNRMDILNWMNLGRVSFKFIIIVLLFRSLYVDVSFVGLASFITEIVLLILSIYYFLSYKPDEVKLGLIYFRKKAIMVILAMSTWVLIHQVGDTLIYRTDNIVINHYWGTVPSGALGSISELGGYVKRVTSLLASLFGPLILIAYSAKKHEEVKALSITQSYIVGTLSAILSAAVAGYSSEILNLWLGEDFVQYRFWLILKMLAVPYFAAGGVMAYTFRVWNRVKIPALGTLAIGALYFVFVLILCWTNSDYSIIIWIIMITTIFTIIQSYFLNAFCVNRIYNGLIKVYCLDAIKILITFLFTFFVSILISNLVPVTTILELVESVGISMVIASLFGAFVMLSKKQRYALVSLIK